LLEGFIVPSKFYGAAAAGRPVLFIGDPDGEISQIIRENECGYVIASADGHGLAGKIESLVADPEQCTRMGMRARQVFERRFNKPLALEAWYGIFRELSVNK
jgi:glycosyltransferase involved in cell wall biosynthesis